MSKFWVLILLTTSYQSVFSQKENRKIDSLCWSEGLRLRWSDFRGIPDTTVVTYMGTSALALTYANIQAQGYTEGGLPNFKVSNYFIRSKSWTIDSAENHLIAHEQLHFDISELYARKIRKGIKELRQKGIKENSVYVELINRCLIELEERNKKYDVETGHSVVDFKQEAWEKNIRKELYSLKDFKSTTQMCQNK